MEEFLKRMTELIEQEACKQMLNNLHFYEIGVARKPKKSNGLRTFNFVKIMLDRPSLS